MAALGELQRLRRVLPPDRGRPLAGVPAGFQRRRLADSTPCLRGDRSPSARLDDAASTVTSADRSVTLTVSPGGTLTDLAFGSGAQKLALPTLARTVLATYREATADALANTQAVMTDLLGDTATPVLDAIRRSIPDDEQPGEYR